MGIASCFGFVGLIHDMLHQIFGHVYFVLHQKRTIHGKVLEMRFVRRGGVIFHGGDLSVVVPRELFHFYRER